MSSLVTVYIKASVITTSQTVDSELGTKEASKEILKEICHFQKRASMLVETHPLEKDL